MKIYIGPYRSWFGPYQLADLLQHVGVSEDRCEKTGEWLDKTWLSRFLAWVDSFKSRTIKIRIDNYDTWNMDSTLSMIIAPMLRQLKATKHGTPFVDNEDVPVELSSLSASPLTPEQIEMGELDDNHEARWNWVLDEMIWAFEQEEMHNRYGIDPEEKFYSGEWTGMIDIPLDAEGNRLPPERAHEAVSFEWKKKDDNTFKVDKEASQKYHERKQNGFRLFGKYYQALWD